METEIRTSRISHHSWNQTSKKVIEKMGFAYRSDEDLWDSVAKGDGLLATYTLDRDHYLDREA